MGKVVAQAIMSLDGYVAKQDNTIGRLFDWLQNGEIEIPTPAGDFAVHLTRRARNTGGGRCPQSAHWSAAGRCSTVPTAGEAGTHSTSRRRRDAPGPRRLGRRTPRGTVHLRHRRSNSRSRSRTDARRRPRRRRHRWHRRPAMPGPGAARRGGHRPRPGRDGRGQPPLLRQAVQGRRAARQPISLRSRRPRHSPGVPSRALTADLFRRIEARVSVAEDPDTHSLDATGNQTHNSSS
jgi:hypothetical protein